MDGSRMVTVILTMDLLEHLRRRAQHERVPMSWLLTGLIARTMIDAEDWGRLTWGAPIRRSDRSRPPASGTDAGTLGLPGRWTR
jgi:hypothetical protein